MKTLALLDTWTKTPRERMDYDVSFVDWLQSENDAPAAVSPLTVTAEPGITVESSSLSDGVAKVWLSGGLNGQSYRVALLLATQGGRVKEAEFQINVAEL